jgi:hypothetical protein
MVRQEVTVSDPLLSENSSKTVQHERLGKPWRTLGRGYDAGGSSDEGKGWGKDRGRGTDGGHSNVSDVSLSGISSKIIDQDRLGKAWHFLGRGCDPGGVQR